MPIFPIAVTGSPAEYPLSASKRFHNTSIRFLDGAQQCFRERSQPSLLWQLKYQRQSASELAMWLPFLEGAIAAFPDFLFVDPLTGLAYANSRVVGQEVAIEQVGVDRTRLEINIGNEGV